MCRLKVRAHDIGFRWPRAQAGATAISASARAANRCATMIALSCAARKIEPSDITSRAPSRYARAKGSLSERPTPAAGPLGASPFTLVLAGMGLGIAGEGLGARGKNGSTPSPNT